MIYKYEMACKEAGLSEEQTAKIRRFFDAEKKKLRRDVEAREAEGIVFNSIATFSNDEEDSETFELVSDVDLEETMIHQMDLEKLNKCLQELSADDREFLYALYGNGYGAESHLARVLGIPRQTLQRRKERLLQTLREKFS
jgi:DNA-directed RNA polymerase specialized sigma24 family protein